MPGVPSVGTVDYNNNLYQTPQNNEEQQAPVVAEQMPVESEQMPVDLSQQIPVDYSSEMGEQKKSGSLLLPLCGLVLLGLAGFGGYKYGVKKGGGETVDNAIKEELKQLKNSDAVKNYETVKKELEEYKNTVTAEGYEKFQKAVNEIDETVQRRFGAKKRIKNILADLKKSIDEIKEKARKAKEAESEVPKE